MAILNRILKIIFLIYFVSIPVSLYAVTGTGGLADTVFNFGTGARPAGLGNAFTSVADDSTASYWNPGAMTQVERINLTMYSSFLWEGTIYNFISYLIPSMNGYVTGINGMFLYTGGAERRDEFNQITGTSFGSLTTAVSYSYAQELITRKLSLGISSRINYAGLDTVGKSDLGLDVGLFWRVPYGLSTGLLIRNLINLKLFGDTFDIVPVTLRAGVSYRFIKQGILVSCDLVPQGKGVAYFLGTEIPVFNGFNLRIGQNINEFNLGLGFNLPDLQMDYALSLHPLGPTHRLSVSLWFGKSISAIKLDQQTKIITQRQIEFKKMYLEGLSAFEKGMFNIAYSRLLRAQDLEPQDKEVQKYVKMLQGITSIISDITAQDKVSDLFRKSIFSYFNGNYKLASLQLEYAFSLAKDDELANRIKRFSDWFYEQTKIKPDLVLSPIGLVADKIRRVDPIFKEGKYTDVIRILENEVLILEPNNAEALLKLGSTYFAMELYEKSLSMYEKYLKLRPQDEKTREFINREIRPKLKK